jgi:uncharacterized membrane protein YkoI
LNDTRRNFKEVFMLSFILASLFLVLSSGAFASVKEEALKLVPGGTVVQETFEEVKIKTPQNSIVEVEFDSSGKFEEASGDNLEKDVLVPAEEILSLKAVVESLKKEGKNPIGEWSLEKSFIRGWHYEFEGHENGSKFDYIVDAKTGILIESRIDD